MKMIIGGAYQGKLAYGRSCYPQILWVDGSKCPFEAIQTCDGIYHLQELIRRMMKEDREEELLELMSGLPVVNPNIVLISEEIGYGLVPVDAFDRRYREMTGRICTSLAAASTRVDRVICGIGVMIKGQEERR